MNTNRKSTQDHLNEQRAEAEVKDILKDLENLRSFTAAQKNRWIWELVQNAHDEDRGKGVNIKVTLSEKEVCFEHDGRPFTVPNLLAITRRTSTKSLEGEDGNAGKFGTGFVTTHVLHPQVKLSGVLKNDEGERPFTDYLLDRSATGFKGLSTALNEAFKEVDRLDLLPPQQIENYITRYRYALNEQTYPIAEGGLQQLENNLAFTLLVNREKIKTIEINRSGKQLIFQLETKATDLENIRFARLKSNDSSIGEKQEGLLYMESTHLVLGLPVIRKETTYIIQPLSHAARIYRSFPLIGTEAFHLPFLLHSERFEPSQYRDGVRTRKTTEEEEDPVADANREVFIDYVKAAQAFFNALNNATDITFHGLHRLAESGLPDDPGNYLGRDWYIQSIQQPYREQVLETPLVNTVSGTRIRLSEACFIEEVEGYTGDFFNLVADFHQSTCPSRETYHDWLKIVAQEPEQWPGVTQLTVEDFVCEVAKAKHLDTLPFEKQEKAIAFLDGLLDFLEATSRTELAEQNTVCPNVKGDFQPLKELEKDPGLQPELKPITLVWGEDVDDKLLHPDMKQRNRFAFFSLNDFYLKLNTTFGNSDIPPSEQEQVETAFALACLAKPTHAPKRELWFGIMHDLLPELTPQRIEVQHMSDFSWEPVDKWTLRYVTWKVQEAKTLDNFVAQYFGSNEEGAIQWLNRLLDFVSQTRDDARDAAWKYAIFPTQSRTLVVKNNDLVREDPPHSFPELLKAIYKNWEGNRPDPKTRLLDNRINTTDIRGVTIEWLAGPVDGLFETNEAEKRVEENEAFKSMFHQLNGLFNENEHVAEKLVHFGRRRAFLQMKALGEDINKVLPLLGRPAEEVEALANLQLSVAQLNDLKQAADSIGAEKLLEKVAEMVAQSERVSQNQKVGEQVEKALKKALENSAFKVERQPIGSDYEVECDFNHYLILDAPEKKILIEVKSARSTEVRMTPTQGDKACNPDGKAYVLCVVPLDTEVIDETLIQRNARFITNIGPLLEDRVQGVKAITLRQNEETAAGLTENSMVHTKIEGTQVRYAVQEKAWKTQPEPDSISFDQFVSGKVKE